MSVYAISDLHLSFSSDKPMDVFGETWENHFTQICDDWRSKVSEKDTVLMAGDFSWAMTVENALIDFDEIKNLPGKKIIIRGNHDYWWHSYTNLYKTLSEMNVYPLQNNAMKEGRVVYCGSRGWTLPELNKTEEDVKIYKRELIRMEMSLAAATKLVTDNEPIVAMIHFPPFEQGNASTDFTNLFEKYGVTKVVYGHLHGKQGRTEIECEKNGIKYYLTSCDKLGNKLYKIL